MTITLGLGLNAAAGRLRAMLAEARQSPPPMVTEEQAQDNARAVDAEFAPPRPVATKIKAINCKIFGPDGKMRGRLKPFKAPPGMVFTEDDVARALYHILSTLEPRFPGHEIDFVNISRGRYNVIVRAFDHGEGEVGCGCLAPVRKGQV